MELGDCLKSVDEVFDSFNSFADVADYVSYNGRKPEFWKFLTDDNFEKFDVLESNFNGISEFLSRFFVGQFSNVGELFDYFKGEGSAYDYLLLVGSCYVSLSNDFDRLFLREINNKFGVGIDIAVLNCIIDREDFNSKASFLILFADEKFDKQVIKSVLLKYGSNSAWIVWSDFLSKGWVEGCEWLRSEWDITVEDVVAGVLNDPDPYYLWRRMKEDFYQLGDRVIGIDSIEWFDLVKSVNVFNGFNVEKWGFDFLFNVVDSMVSAFPQVDDLKLSGSVFDVKGFQKFVKYSYIQIHYIHEIDFEGMFESWFGNIDMDDIFNLQLFKGFMVNVGVEGFPFGIAANLAVEVDLTEGELNFSEGIYV